MQPQTELMFNIRDDIDANIEGLSVALSELKDDGRVYAELGAGYADKVYTRGKGLYVHPVLFICKGNNEPEIIEKLSKIANYYKAGRKPPKGGSYTAVGLQVAAEPGKIERQEDEQLLYSCAINFKIIY